MHVLYQGFLTFLRKDNKIIVNYETTCFQQVGQNYAESSGFGMAVDRISMIKRLVKSWYDEVKDMNPSLVAGVQFIGPVIGHYTQVVWGETTRVGCGLTHKQEEEGGQFNIRLVCNYKGAGNWVGERVYTAGDAASKCAKKSAEYPGLCEPQEEGDKPESDASAPTSSASGSAGSSSAGSPTDGSSSSGSSSTGSPAAGSSSAGSPPSGFTSGSSKPVVSASSGFGKPVFVYASSGYPAAFASSGIPEKFASMGSFNANPYKTLGKVQTFQFFNEDTGTIPGLLGSSPNGKQITKVLTVGSVPLSPADIQSLLSRINRQDE